MTTEQFVTVSRTQVREFFEQTRWYSEMRGMTPEELTAYFWSEMHPFHTSANLPHPEDGSPR